LSEPTPANAAERLASSVQEWLVERIQAGAPESPDNLFAELLERVEPVLLNEVMRRVRGNRWVAAQWLGLNRATVRKKLAKYGLAKLYQQPDLSTNKE